LVEIFEKMISDYQIVLTDPARTRAKELIGRLSGGGDEHFGNARVMRNFFEFIQKEQANRLAAVTEPSREQLMVIEEDDIVAAGNDLTSMERKISDS
jgi:hypothetical protein